MNAWLTLTPAMATEVAASSTLKACAGCSRRAPGGVVVAGYATAFWFLGLTLRHMPIGVAYAVWSGVGTVLITLIGAFTFRQKLDLPGLDGIALIIAGVLVLNLLSQTHTH
ncbi:MAG: multidrug efflux SMR transporter [Rhodanobacter sp.]